MIDNPSNSINLRGIVSCIVKNPAIKFRPDIFQHTSRNFEEKRESFSSFSLESSQGNYQSRLSPDLLALKLNPSEHYDLCSQNKGNVPSESNNTNRNHSTLPPQLDSIFTLDDQKRVDQLVEIDRKTQLSIQHIPRETLDTIISSFFSAENSGDLLEYRILLMGYTFAVEKITYFARALSEFEACSIEDKRKLLYQNTDPIFNIKSALFFVSKSSSFLEQMSKFSVFDIGSMIPEPPPMIAPIKWHNFFQSPWATSLEHEEKYERLMNHAAELDLQTDSGCLLQVIALFATDGILMENRIQVELIQKDYMNLLYRFLVKRDGIQNAEEMYCKFIQMMKYLRDMSDIMKNESLKF